MSKFNVGDLIRRRNDESALPRLVMDFGSPNHHDGQYLLSCDHAVSSWREWLPVDSVDADYVPVPPPLPLAGRRYEHETGLAFTRVGNVMVCTLPLDACEWEEIV